MKSHTSKVCVLARPYQSSCLLVLLGYALVAMAVPLLQFKKELGIGWLWFQPSEALVQVVGQLLEPFPLLLPVSVRGPPSHIVLVWIHPHFLSPGKMLLCQTVHKLHSFFEVWDIFPYITIFYFQEIGSPILVHRKAAIPPKHEFKRTEAARHMLCAVVHSHEQNIPIPVLSRFLT